MEYVRPRYPQSAPDARPSRWHKVTPQPEDLDRNVCGFQAVLQLARPVEADDPWLIAFSIQSADELDGEPFAATDVKRVDQMEYADHRFVQ
jgi:hypothetical protein